MQQDLFMNRLRKLKFSPFSKIWAKIENHWKLIPLIKSPRDEISMPRRGPQPLWKTCNCHQQSWGTLYFLKRSVTCLTKGIFVYLYNFLVKPHLEYAIQANCPYLKKGIGPLGKNPRDSNKVGKMSWKPQLWRDTQSPKTTVPWKKKVRKWFGPDPQNTIQPNRPGCNSTVKVHSMARTKRMIH